MPAIPQTDGALRLHQPHAHTRYDMGNQYLFITWNGQGDASRLILVAGAWGGGWHVRLRVDEMHVDLHEARALGRLWQLQGEVNGVHIELDSFLDEDTPVARQRLQVHNRSQQARTLHLTIDLHGSAPVSRQERLHSTVANLVPRLPGLGHLWAEGWAKALLPHALRRLRLRSCGLVEGLGTTPVFFSTDLAPISGQRYDRLGIRLHYELPLAPGEQSNINWGLTFGDQAQHEYELARNAAAHTEAVAFAGTLTQAAAVVHDPLLKSLITAGLTNALAMYKVFPNGFAGLVAGREYAYPPRLYFRDSYWTAQILLYHRPELVRRHLLSLAAGVHPDGACPSAVFAPHLAKRWRLRVANRLDWLPDHYDSPSYLLLFLRDYLAATGDTTILDETIHFGALPHQPPRSLWTLAQAAMEHLIRQDTDGDGLIEKPFRANDWADNVRRNVWVSYDQALYVAALRTAADIAHQRGEASAGRYEQLAAQSLQSMNRYLWDEHKGYYVDYKRPGFVEDHLAIDTLVVIRFGLTTEPQTRAILDAARNLLQSRHNQEQPYGDWGILCAFPPYKRRADLFDKSADPYHYHNGGDWPYWDGVYGEILLRRHDLDWRYVLTRWWEYCLAHEWLTPVEYYSPPYPVGSIMNGWSSMPAAALLRYKAGS